MSKVDFFCNYSIKNWNLLVIWQCETKNINLLIPIGLGKTAITVHKDAILKREGMSLVYLVIEDIVQIRPIKLGEAVGNRFIVTDGLQDNDKVVIKGNERLIPGQEVKIVNKK